MKLIRKIKSILQGLLQKPFLKSLSVLPNSGLVTLYDVGAAEFIQQRWMIYTKFINYVGFEPDERSYIDLLNSDNSKKCHSYNILKFALWDSETEMSINLCSVPQDSSIYSPNRNFLENFPNPERFDVVGKEKISVTKMDSLDISSPDFMKLDIQGGELNALKGASSYLNDTLGLELEVEFIELYSNQPLFGDVCDYLSTKGFEFIDFVNLCRWERNDYLNTFGHCTYGDALFLRAPEKIDFENISEDKLSAYLSILVIYRRFDLINTTLSILPEQFSGKFNQFREEVKKAKKIDNLARGITKITSSILGVIAPNYRSHLLY